MHIVAFPGSEVSDRVREGLTFILCAEASIMQFNSSALFPDFTACTRDFIRPQIQ